MPIYQYESCVADSASYPDAYTIERNVPIEDRDNQFCDRCGLPLKRKIVFTGLTWAPTAGGMR